MPFIVILRILAIAIPVIVAIHNEFDKANRH